LVRLGAPDVSLTGSAGPAAVAELVERLDIIAEINAGVGPIKVRRRGAGAGGLLVGMAPAQMLGEGFPGGLDRGRAGPAGQALAAVLTPANTTAAGGGPADGRGALPERGGRSGGPVYSYNNQGAGVLAQGIVSGELTGSNGRQTVIVPISTLSGALGTTASTTGNYYQTCC